MYASLVDCLKAPLPSAAKLKQERLFLESKVFAGLDDRNTGFDSPLIPHFSPSDFLIVIDRCAQLGIEIIGVEAFAAGIELVGLEIAPEPGYEWVRQFTLGYLTDDVVTLCATYGVEAVYK